MHNVTHMNWRFKSGRKLVQLQAFLSLEIKIRIHIILAWTLSTLNPSKRRRRILSENCLLVIPKVRILLLIGSDIYIPILEKDHHSHDLKFRWHKSMTMQLLTGGLLLFGTVSFNLWSMKIAPHLVNVRQ